MSLGGVRGATRRGATPDALYQSATFTGSSLSYSRFTTA